MKLKNVLFGLAISATLAGTAVAGSRWGQDVGIYRGGAFNQAYGMLGTAYNSADSRQTIGCAVVQNESAQGASCYAQTAGGDYASCYTSNPAMITAARSIFSDSYLTFSFNSEGTCTSIRLENYSYNAKK